MPKLMLKIDDQQIEADDSKTLLQAARDAGIFIPTLCHHPALEPFGSCRLCSVEIEKNGRKKIVTSCNYPAEGGLIVRTSSQDVESIRALIIELLLARCPEETIIKSLAADYGIAEPRFKLAGESCIMCGLCARVCEEMVGVSAICAISRGIERAVDAPYRDLSEDCIACGSCALICPTSAIKGMKNVYPLTSQDARAIERSFLQGEYDEEIGFHSDIFACRTLVQGQDGGVVTSMLAAALEKGVIDAAIVVLQGNEYRADATVAENVKTIIDSSGTKYVRVPVISQLREALKSGKRRLAVVGTPCQIRVIRKSQLDGYLGREFTEAEIILIGLFCFESFDHIDLRRHIRDLFTIDIEKAERVQIANGKFSVRMGDEKYSCNVKDLESDVREGCRFCSDFVSRFADLSIGSVGSADGCSTVIIRSDRGRRLLREATYSREAVNKDEIAKLSAIKRKRAEKQSERILEGLAWQNHSPVSVSIK